MKKYVSILLALIMMLSLCACGEKEPAKEYEWQEISGGIEITKYLGDSTKVVVPATLDGKLVVSVSTAFSGNVSLEELELPEMVTKADLTNCTGLKRLTAYGDITLNMEGCGALEYRCTPNSDSGMHGGGFTSLRELDLSNKGTMYMEWIPESVEKLNLANVKRICGDKFLPNLKEVIVSENFKYYYVEDTDYELLIDGRIGSRPIVEEEKEALYCNTFKCDEIIVNGVICRR